MSSVEIQLFAHLRAAHGSGGVIVELPDEVSPETVLKAVVTAAPDLESRLAGVRVALDDRFLVGSAALSAQSRLALIPPVSGG